MIWKSHVSLSPLRHHVSPGYMPHPPQGLDALRDAVLTSGKQQIRVVAVYGPGGVGKTTLTNVLADDPAIREAFPDGVIRVHRGQWNSSARCLAAMFDQISLPNLPPQDSGELSHLLSRELHDKRYLIIIDDVDHLEMLPPLLCGGGGCAHVFTTRDAHLARHFPAIRVREMDDSDATALITSFINGQDPAPDSVRELAQRLGRWPLLVELAGAMVSELLLAGFSADDALTAFHRELDALNVDARNIKAFLPLLSERAKKTARNTVLRRLLSAVFQLLDTKEYRSFYQLSVFPRETPIPVETIAAMWELDPAELTRRLHLYHALRLLHLHEDHIIIHPSVRDALRSDFGGLQGVHVRLVNLWNGGKDPAGTYAWYWTPYHMREAGRTDKLIRFFADWDWLDRRVRTCGIDTVLADLAMLERHESANVLGTVLGLARKVLRRDPDQLAGQLAARLPALPGNPLAELVDQARVLLDRPWVEPVRPILPPASSSPRREITPGANAITTLAGTLSGAVLAGTANGEVILLDGATGHATNRCSVFAGSGVAACAVTPHGCAFCASDDGDLVRIELATLHITDRLSALGAVIRGMIPVSEGGVLICLADGSVSLRSSEAELPIWTHELGDTPISICRTGGEAVSVLTKSGMIYVIETEHGTRAQAFGPHPGAAVVLSPAHRRVVSIAFDGTCVVSDTDTGIQISAFTLPEFAGVATTTQSGHIISAHKNSGIIVWEPDNGNRVATLATIAADVALLASTRHGMSVVHHDNPQTIEVQETPDIPYATDDDRCDDAISLCFLSDKELLVARKRGVVELWNPDQVGQAEPATRFDAAHEYGTDVRPVCLEAQSNVAVCGWTDGTFRVWETDSRADPPVITNHDGSVESIATSGRGIIVTGSYGEVTIWRRTSSTVEPVLTVPCTGIPVVSASGEFVMVADESGSIRVWNVTTRECSRLQALPSGSIVGASLCGESRTVVALNDGCIYTYNATDAEPVLLANSPVRTLTTAGGNIVLSGSSEGVLQVWDLDANREITAFDWTGEIDAVAISPDGTLAAAISSGEVSVFHLRNISVVH
jgi:WD40 repeat protein